MKIKMISVLLFTNSLIACGGGGSADSPSDNVTTNTGVFIDSPVSGLRYSTTSQNDLTNTQGEFTYQDNESVTFSIGDISFPSIPAKSTISPLDIFSTDDINNTAVLNMLRLLQSLDVDGKAENGIEISETAHQLATGLSIDFTDANFDAMVQNLVMNSGSVYQTLISAQQAKVHFSQTLAGISESGCTSNHSKVGYRGVFDQFSHGISGEATIKDDCTIEIRQFNYDGGGPAVYFYGGVNHQYSSPSAFQIGDLLTGTVYQGETVTITLPEGKTLDDFTGISVWCVQFGANFGHVDFLAPQEF